MDQQDRETRRAFRRAAHEEAKNQRRESFEQLTDTVRFHAEDAATYAKPLARGLRGAVIEVGRWVLALVVCVTGLGVIAAVVSGVLAAIG